MYANKEKFPLSIPKLEDLEITETIIGKGTFGFVKLANCLKTKRKFALKIIDLSKLTKDDLFCVEREIQIHSKLQHPNIIRLYAHYKKENTVFLLLEYACHGNLFAHIRKKKRLSETEAFRLFLQTAMALDYLHKNDILHRDIKPENLLLDENFDVKLCDFGWATRGISLKRNTFCGTYEYMSPEVVFKKPYNENIDLWALGVLLYEMVHGKSPYKAKDLREISSKITLCNNNIVFSDDISIELKNLISNMLKFNPCERLTMKKVLENAWIKKMNTKLGIKNENFKVETPVVKVNLEVFAGEENKMMNSSRKNPLIFEKKNCDKEDFHTILKDMNNLLRNFN